MKMILGPLTHRLAIYTADIIIEYEKQNMGLSMPEAIALAARDWETMGYTEELISAMSHHLRLWPLSLERFVVDRKSIGLPVHHFPPLRYGGPILSNNDNGVVFHTRYQWRWSAAVAG